LLENYEEAAFKLFIYEHEMENTEKLKEESIPADVERHAEETYPGMIKMIRRNMNKQLMKGAFSKSLLKVLRTAAVFVLIIYIGFTVAIAASSNVRRCVVEFLAIEHDGYNTVGFFENGMTVEVPTGWQESYYPTFIPAGFEIEYLYINKLESNVNCLNSECDNILIKVGGIGIITNYNTENGEVINVDINGTEAEATIHESGRVHIVWPIGDRYAIVSSTLGLDEVICICESFRIIK